MAALAEWKGGRADEAVLRETSTAAATVVDHQCAESGCDGWHRDVDAVANAWGNMEALRCSKCGRENTEHEDCGQYPLNEPIKPNGGPGELKIPGIHKAR